MPLTTPASKEISPSSQLRNVCVAKEPLVSPASAGYPYPAPGASEVLVDLTSNLAEFFMKPIAALVSSTSGTATGPGPIPEKFARHNRRHARRVRAELQRTVRAGCLVSSKSTRWDAVRSWAKNTMNSGRRISRWRGRHR